MLHRLGRCAVDDGLVAQFADGGLQRLDFVGERPGGDAEAAVLDVEPLARGAQVGDFARRAPAETEADEHRQDEQGAHAEHEGKGTHADAAVNAGATVRDDDREAGLRFHYEVSDLQVV